MKILFYFLFAYIIYMKNQSTKMQASSSINSSFDKFLFLQEILEINVFADFHKKKLEPKESIDNVIKIIDESYNNLKQNIPEQFQ